MSDYTALYRRIKRYQRQHQSLTDMALKGLIDSRRRLTQEEQTALDTRAQVLSRQLDLMNEEAAA